MNSDYKSILFIQQHQTCKNIFIQNINHSYICCNITILTMNFSSFIGVSKHAFICSHKNDDHRKKRKQHKITKYKSKIIYKRVILITFNSYQL